MFINCASLDSFMHSLSGIWQLNEFCCKINCEILIFTSQPGSKIFIWRAFFLSPSTCTNAMVAPCNKGEAVWFYFFVVMPLLSTDSSCLPSHKCNVAPFATIAFNYIIMRYNFVYWLWQQTLWAISAVFWDHNSFW